MYRYLIFTCFLVATTVRADWPQYLGPNRNATTQDCSILRSWPEGGPRQLWSFPLGRGHGGASVQGGDVFVLDRIVDKSDILRCIDLETGTEKWSYAYSAVGKHSHPGSRAVPTVDEGHVWIVGPFGHFHCISRATHKPIWNKHILNDFAADKPRWGVAQSPLLYRDMVIVAPQGKQAGVVAFNKKTGAVRWKSRTLQGIPSFVSLSLVKIGGIDQVIMISAGDRDDESVRGEVTAFDVTNGELLWSYRDFNTFVNIAPPAVVGEGRFFLTNGSTGGHWDPISIMFEVKPNGNDFLVKELYRTGEFAGKMHPPILHDGYLYFNDIRKPSQMCCVSIDGKLMWKAGPEFQLGAFILADGLILNQDGKSGDLYLIDPSPEGYQELAKAEIFPDKKGEPWAPLALSKGKLLIRDGQRLICLDLKN